MDPSVLGCPYVTERADRILFLRPIKSLVVMYTRGILRIALKNNGHAQQLLLYLATGITLVRLSFSGPWIDLPRIVLISNFKGISGAVTGF